MNESRTLAGRFRLEEKLGDGASGELHRAVEIDGGRVAIVHIVRAEGGSARRDRLLREMKRAAQVKHEGLAVVLDVGQTDDGAIFVAVENSEGEHLSDRLRSGTPLDDREATGIASQIARAVAVAHDAGVVHRDLRPSVIGLSGEGEQARVKVEGLATPRLGTFAADDAEAAYAAPEQRRGDSVGRRADVYSIGAMLYAMLTGKAPEPSSSAIESGLGDVVRRCLAEDPRERFLDTIALGAALRAAMESTNPRVSSKPPAKKSLPAPPPTTPARPSSPVQAPARASTPAPALTPAPGPTSERPPPSASLRPSQRPASAATPSSRPPASVRPPPVVEAPPLGRAPAAPPPRPLGRPLTARPAWEEALLDLRDGPLPRIAATVVIAFVIARIVSSGIVPFVVAVVAGVAAYATKYWRRPRADK